MEKLVSSPLKPPVNPRLQGVFPVLAVEKPVENVENSCGQGCGYIHNFVFMSTDFPYIGRYYCYSFYDLPLFFFPLRTLPFPPSLRKMANCPNPDTIIMTIPQIDKDNRWIYTYIK